VEGVAAGNGLKGTSATMPGATAASPGGMADPATATAMAASSATAMAATAATAMFISGQNFPRDKGQAHQEADQK
jgi:hypothetical protein